MASGASTVSVVKAGYWISRKDITRHLSDIPSELFTHLYAGFANVANDGSVNILDPFIGPIFAQTVPVRNRTVKTLLSIGGEGADLSAVVASSDKRKNLIRGSIDLARQFGFDGLDLCWLYPSNASLEKPLASLLYEWRVALDEDFTKKKRPNKLLLTAAVFHHPVIPGADDHNAFSYPIQAISDYLDWINVLAIDFYTPSKSPNESGPVHAWNTRSMDEQDKCGRVGIEKWIDSGVAPNKLVLGLPFYGYEWSLKNPNSIYGFFAPAHIPANTLPAPKAYRDIQEELRGGIYETVYHSHYIAVYSNKINGEKWIGYDDGLCISGKVSEARNRNLGGYFAWSVGADDVNWTLSRSAFESTTPPEANP